jgi:ribosome-associated protein
VDALEEKMGEEIVLLDLREVALFTDFFIICSGTSDRMLDALLEGVEDVVHETYNLRPRVEGISHDGWVLVDYGDVILHLFSPEQRDYYRLEDLWSHGKLVLHLQ